MDQDYFAGYRDGIEDMEKEARKVGLIKGIKRFYKGVPIGKTKEQYLQGLRNIGRDVVRTKDPAMLRALKGSAKRVHRTLRSGSPEIAAVRKRKTLAGGISGLGLGLGGAGYGLGVASERHRPK